jgi:glutamate synthase (NADPH/NADH) small chain
MWGVMTKRFSGVEVRVSQLECCQVEWVKQDGGWKIKELGGTDFVIAADLVILALGFEHVVHEGLIKEMGLRLDERGNVSVQNYQTSEPWVFAAGDTVNGASLVVRAICSGREAAAAIDRQLKESS